MSSIIRIFFFILINFNLGLRTVFPSSPNPSGILSPLALSPQNFLPKNSNLENHSSKNPPVNISPDRRLIRKLVHITQSLAEDGFVAPTEIENIIKNLMNFFHFLKRTNRSEAEENHIQGLFNQLFTPNIFPNFNRLVFAGLLQSKIPEFNQYKEELKKIIPLYHKKKSDFLLEYLIIKIQDQGLSGKNPETLCQELKNIFNHENSSTDLQIKEMNVLGIIHSYRLLSFGFQCCPFITSILQKYKNFNKQPLSQLVSNLKESGKRMESLIENFRTCHKDLKKTIKKIFHTKETNDPSKLFELQTQRNMLISQITTEQKNMDEIILRINIEVQKNGVQSYSGDLDRNLQRGFRGAQNHKNNTTQENNQGPRRPVEKE